MDLERKLERQKAAAIRRFEERTGQVVAGEYK
jgi:hypothetical protein